LNIKYVILIAVIGQLTFFGCVTARGPCFFSEVPLSEYKGKAIVYFYKYDNKGGAVLSINKRGRFLIENAGYFLIVVDPGTYNFEVSYGPFSKEHTENTFTLEEDRAYYIRYVTKFDKYVPSLVPLYVKMKYSIDSVTRDEALEILQKCRLIEVHGYANGYIDIGQ